MIVYIKRGNTWTPELEITDNDGTALDCTDYIVKMWIKELLKETAAEIQELDINWTDRLKGKGYFNLTNAMSKNMLGRYWREIILYKETTLEEVETLDQNKLIIRETLEKDL